MRGGQASDGDGLGRDVVVSAAKGPRPIYLRRCGMNKRYRAGVVLSGCGHLDGTEIHEAVFSLLYLDREGFEVRCFAPDKPLHHVVNHVTGQAGDETRNVLVESARIARGRVTPLSQATMADLDALVLPGGNGAAKNLSDVAFAGRAAKVDEDVVRLIGEAWAAKKPIVAICIAPAVVAAALHKLGHSAKVTIGNDAGTAEMIEGLGCTHENCIVSAACVDGIHQIITTPAYMLGPGPKDVAAGIEAAIVALRKMLSM